MGYEDVDRVTRDLINSYYMASCTRPVNGGTRKNPIGPLIMGHLPDETIPFKDKDETSYLWYYLGRDPFDANRDGHGRSGSRQGLPIRGEEGRCLLRLS